MTLPPAQHVRDILAAALTEWTVLEVRGEEARVQRAPQIDTLIRRFEALFGLEWSLEWQCYSTQPYLVRAAFAAGSVRREGLGEAGTLKEAQQQALTQLLTAFGAYSADEHWVEYDSEEGPNTAELPYLPAGARPEDSAAQSSNAGQRQADFRPDSQAQPGVQDDPPADPQMLKARQHIDRLMEELRAAGKGKEAARITLQHGGYGKDLAESRAIYKELQGLQKS